jgi:hypothetical protein
MMIEVEIGRQRARFDGVWDGADADMIAAFNAGSLDPSGADPDPELTEARRVVAAYGGRIVRQEPPEYVEGRVY